MPSLPRIFAFGALIAATALATTAAEFKSGKDAMGDWTDDEPGLRRTIMIADLPEPYATDSTRNMPRPVKRRDNALPKAPAGFVVSEFATGLKAPRVIVTAPNGDVFVSESESHRVRVLRDSDGDGRADVKEVFSSELRQPFGIAFYPLGANPRFVYVANTDSVVRFPYKSGNLKASGPPEIVVSNISAGGRLTGGGHWTRDIVFSDDGRTLFVSVGSLSNVTDDEIRIVNEDIDRRGGHENARQTADDEHRHE